MVKGEEVKRGGRPPVPTRFFVAGPPQNDMNDMGVVLREWYVFGMVGV